MKYRFLLLLLLIVACREKPKVSLQEPDFSFPLNEKCMIINQYGNYAEGNYLKAIVSGSTDTIFIEGLNEAMSPGFVKGKWVLGWGTGKAYFDAGLENLLEIDSFLLSDNAVIPGALLRGEGFPANGQRVCFWNRFPSNFQPVKKQSLEELFSTKSIVPAQVVFNEKDSMFIAVLNEVDVDFPQHYLVQSADQIHWKLLHTSASLIRIEDCLKSTYCGYTPEGKPGCLPTISDVVMHDNDCYLFIDGFNMHGKRQIGHLKIKGPDWFSNLLGGNYELSQNASLPAGPKGSWEENGCFYPKILFDGAVFRMFYTGIGRDGSERLGMAVSDDLVSWRKHHANPVIDHHQGWRSKLSSSEPAYVGMQNGRLVVMLAGTKKFHDNLWARHVSKTAYTGESGNVDDIQHGLYWSADSGKSFFAHPDNPLLVNDYACPNENEHMGGFIYFFHRNDSLYMLYSAKTSDGVMRYTNRLRGKKS